MELFVPEPTLNLNDDTELSARDRLNGWIAGGHTKRAGATLDEDPANWPKQILTQLYQELPSIAEFSPQVMLVKVDRERGAALGVIKVVKSTNSAMAAIRANDGGAPKVAIPLVIKDYELQPLDLLMKPGGQMVPLTEVRLREALFRPETFDLLTKDYGNTSLFGMLYPPSRSDNSFGSGFSSGGSGTAQYMFGSGMKLSSKNFPLLEEISGALHHPDLERLARTIEGTAGMTEKLAENANLFAAVRLLASASDSATKTASAMVETAFSAYAPDVLQLGYSDAHRAYWIKSASRSAFASPAPRLLSRREFLKYAGEEVVKKVDTEGVVTVAEPTAELDVASPGEKRWSVVEEPGIYNVQALDGRELTGWVLPGLLDPSGVRVPLSVFTNGSEATVQGTVVGSRVATGADLPDAPPKGTGVFYTESNGQLVATVPLLVLGLEAGMNGGNAFLVKTLEGQDTRVHFVEGVHGLVATGNEFFAPHNTRFLPLDKEKAVALHEHPQGMESAKMAALFDRGHLVLRTHGTQVEATYHNLPKLASVFPKYMDMDEAAYMLCVAGLGSKDAYTKLAELHLAPEVVTGLVDPVLQSDLLYAAKTAAAPQSAQVTSLRRFLVKEAALMPEATTVDALLSLGFINSENIKLFISRLPYLEKALSMLCELVLASRLGMSEIPEQAGARAARGLDEVIQGLRALMLRSAAETSG